MIYFMTYRDILDVRSHIARRPWILLKLMERREEGVAL
jgi:hypothetical protein